MNTTTAWRRTNQAAMPHLPTMIDEPICSEALQCLDDVLLSGSDDEYYEDSAARRRRIEEQAQMYLEGRRPFLLSASLRGPFGRESGWENPWRGKGRAGRAGKAAVVAVPEISEPAEAALPDTLQDTPDTTPTTSPVLPAMPMSALNRDLGSIPGITALGEPTRQLRKRSASTDWLRRKNLKRMRPVQDSDSAPSPTAVRVTKPMVVAKAFKTPVLARSFSAPVEPRVVVTAAKETEAAVEPEESLEESHAISHISDSERCMSVPSDILWTSHSEMHRDAPEEIDETIMLDLASSIDAGTMHGVEAEAEAEVAEDTEMAENIDAVEEDSKTTEDEDEDIDLASQQIATEEAQFESQRSSSPAPAPSDATEIVVVGPPVTQPEVSEQTPTPTPSKDSVTVKTRQEASEQTEDERLATQFQSPWSKPAALVMDDIIDDDTIEAGAEEDEATSTKIEDEDMPTVDGDVEAESNDDTITKLPLPVVSTTTQSPFSRESQWQLPAPSSPPALPALSATPTRNVSISQNPWVEESAPNLPTSPCSPGQDVTLPQFSSERHEEHQQQEQQEQQEPFLPSLPIPIPLHSSGTAPSTPDTKQSSLPTPDMTMSIKSFRRFRSPTPTPPPRRKSNKKGGPRSILKQTRRKANASSASGRRVQFSLPGDEGNSDKDESADAATEGVEADEEDFIKAGLSGTSRGRQFTCDLQAKSAKTRSSHRAASPPPPQDKALMESLPSEVDKFQGHFASVAGRANGTTVQVKEVKGITIAAETPKLQQTSQQPPAVQREISAPESTVTTSGFNKDTNSTGKENAWAGNDGDDDAESVVDDVQEVMDNLDDFLGMWDMDAELAQVRRV